MFSNVSCVLPKHAFNAGRGFSSAQATAVVVSLRSYHQLLPMLVDGSNNNSKLRMAAWRMCDSHTFNTVVSPAQSDRVASSLAFMRPGLNPTSIIEAVEKGLFTEAGYFEGVRHVNMSGVAFFEYVESYSEFNFAFDRWVDVAATTDDELFWDPFLAYFNSSDYNPYDEKNNFIGCL